MKSKLSSLINKDPSKSVFISRHGIKIYPISENEFNRRRGIFGNSKMWLIEINNNGKIKTFPKKINNSEIDDATWSTINYYYKLLKSK